MFFRFRLLLAVAIVVATAHVTVRPQDMPQDDVPPALVVRAQDVVDRLAAGDVEPVRAMFTEQMKSALGEDRLRGIFPGLVTQAGAFKARTGARTLTRGVMRVVVVTCSFERSDVDVHVAFNPADRIGGLSVRPSEPPIAYAAPAYVTPASFRSEAVTVDAGGWPLPATLTMPTGDGPFPGMVMVHGSGPADRDTSFGPNKPFRDLAEGLSSRGVAVLRYDKCTAVHPRRVAGLRSLTVKEEVIDDAVAAVKLLRGTPGVRADRVFVLGHSLGGMLAPRIAAADASIAGLIVMAGAVRALEQAIQDQTRYVAMLDGSISADEQMQLDAAAKLAADVRALKSPDDPPITVLPFSAPAAYYLDLRGYDPPAVAATIAQPMLILQGARDYQVTMDDLAKWKQALAARRDVQITSYSTLDHLFIAGSGPSSPTDYSKPGHVDEAVIKDIAAWIQARD